MVNGKRNKNIELLIFHFTLVYFIFQHCNNLNSLRDGPFDIQGRGVFQLN